MAPSAVPGGFPLDLRRAAKLAAPPDDGALQQAALGQILQQRRHAFVHFRQLPAHDLEVLLVRVPALVVDRDVGHAVFDQPPRHQAGLPERVAAVAVAQVVLLLRQIEHLAGVAEDQFVGLFLGFWPSAVSEASSFRACPKVSSLWSRSRRSRCCCVGDALGDDALDGEPALGRIAAGGERFVARCPGSRPPRSAPAARSTRCRAESAAVAGVVALEQRDHGADAGKDLAPARASARSEPCRTPFRGR